MPFATLLVNPPAPSGARWVREGRCQQFDIWGAPFPPLTLAMMAGQLGATAAGARTQVLDAPAAGLGAGATVAAARAFAPDLVVLATATPTIDDDLGWFAPLLKVALPAVRLAAVGIHVTALPERTLLDYPSLDFVVCGEPELTCRDLALALAAGSPDPATVAGVACRRGGGVVRGPERDLVADLDQLAPPAWAGVDLACYRMPLRDAPFLLVPFGRGCPYSCRFCAARTWYGPRLRLRSPEAVVADVRHALEQHGVRDYLFWTESTTADPVHLRRVLALLVAEGLHREVRWVCNSRADLQDLGLLPEMRAAGCWQVAFGIEFGTDRALALAGKGGRASVAAARACVEAAYGAGLAADGHFILGYPGEREADLDATVDFACELPLTFAHFYAATAFPGSALYEQARSEGLLANASWRGVQQAAPALRTTDLAPEVVRRHLARAYARFYLRPSAVARVARLAWEIGGLSSLARLGPRFVLDVVAGRLRAALGRRRPSAEA